MSKTKGDEAAERFDAWAANQSLSYKSRILDRTLLYTAFTRARVKVILLRDLVAAVAAIKTEPHSSRRKVMLGALMREKIQQNV